MESIKLEIISEKTRNTIVSVLFRPPNGHSKQFENFLTKLFSIQKTVTKMFISQEISILTYWIIASIKKCRTMKI